MASRAHSLSLEQVAPADASVQHNHSPAAAAGEARKTSAARQVGLAGSLLLPTSCLGGLGCTRGTYGLTLGQPGALPCRPPAVRPAQRPRPPLKRCALLQGMGRKNDVRHQRGASSVSGESLQSL